MPKHLRILLTVLVLSSSLFGQAVSLRGVISDESGGVIPGATVTLTDTSGSAKKARSNAQGAYQFNGLASGDYTVQVTAPGLALAQPVKTAVNSAGQTLNLVLKLTAVTEQVTVGDVAAGRTVSTEASSNASALVLRGEDLQALADDPTDLAADLQALAGPSAGPNGGSIFIDGFSGGQLPSKESIREIRINQNPFSPEYDKLGFGRIEIFTKPGSDKFKGAAYYNYAHDALNSRNPYSAQKAPFELFEYGGSLSGPVNKRSSFFFDVRRDAIDNGAIINGTVLDPTTLAVINPFTQVFLVPQRRVTLGPRLDYQLSTNHTLAVRYSYNGTDIPQSNVGSFNLPSRGVDAATKSNTLQLTETAVLGSRAINELRFQYFRLNSTSTANDAGPAIQVIGAFTGGGAQVGRSSQTSNSYELQNYTSLLRGAHSIKFGVRVRSESLDTVSPVNFGGSFAFGGGLAPQLDAANRPVLGPNGQPVQITIDSIERYRRTLLLSRLGLTVPQMRALGGGPTQFSLNAGNPALAGSQTDLGFFIGDDWRARANLTISAGLRYEYQTNISDWRDLAPRIGIAWAPGATAAKARPKTVLRAGFGMFYDRFALSNTFTAQRYNGLLQQQYVVTNPDFYPTIPDPSALPGLRSTQTVQRVAGDVRAPYVMQSALSFERQLPFNSTIAVTYANTHGLHILRSRDLNAPLPGTFDPLSPTNAQYPLGKAGPLFQMESAGLYNQNQLITNVNTKVNSKISLFGSYVLNKAMSNTDGLGTFPANPYSFVGEYGPASTDIRHRGSLGGAINTKWDIRLNPLFVVDSGPPFDLTVGRDLYGTTLFNGRPGIATNSNKPGLVATSYGLLDPNPTPDQSRVGRNFGRGPGSIMLNLRIGKTFSFGRGEGQDAPTNIPGGGPQRSANAGVFSSGGAAGGAPAKTSHRYNIIVSMSIRNVLNHTNPGAIIGNITSPLFGRANQMAGGGGGGGFSEAANNRRMELQTRFTF